MTFLTQWFYRVASDLRLAAWLWFASSLILSGIFSVNLFYFQLPETTSLFYLYLFCAILGWAMALSLLPWLVMSVFAFLPLGKRFSSIIGFLAFAGLLLVCIISGRLYALYRFHLDPFFIELFFTNFQTFGFSALTILLAVVGVLVVFSLVVALMIVWRKWFSGRWRKIRVLLVSIMLSLLLIGQAIHVVSFEYGRANILSVTPMLPWYKPLIMGDELRRWGWIDVAAKPLKMPKVSGNFVYPKHTMQCAQTDTPNVLFITLESWRFDAMNAQATPFVQKVANESLWFTNHLSGGNVTIKGLFSLLFALNPSYWPAVEAGGRKPVFVQLLQDLNYQFFIQANQNIQRDTTKRVLYGDIDVAKATGYGGNTRGDEQATSALLAQIATAKGNWFGHLILNATHHPYFADLANLPFQPSAKIEMGLVNNQTDATPYFNQYLNAAWQIDKQIERLFLQLEELKQLSNTLVVITSDHGEEFNDNGQNYWGHGSNFTRYQLGVPLVIYWPDSQTGHLKQGAYSHQTSHQDVVATIMQDAFRCSNPLSDYSDGVSLFDPQPRKIIAASYINTAFIDGTSVSAMLAGYVDKYDLDDIQANESAHVMSMQEYIEAQGRFRK